MSILLANYHPEREAFSALSNQDCDKRILLFCGSSGSGKTTLLNYCFEQIPPGIKKIPIQLRGSAVSAAEIFNRTGNVLQWDNMTHFTKQVAKLEGTPDVQIDRNWMGGINNKINVALRVENQADREHRLVSLTNAWFDDVRTLQQPSLLLFDTYEDATSEIKNWLSGPFLARVAYTQTVRVVIAGQEVPDENNIEWGQFCNARNLYGVKEARHWMPIVEAKGRYIPFAENPETWLAGVCYALQGDPSEIIKVIKGLPQKPEAA